MMQNGNQSVNGAGVDSDSNKSSLYKWFVVFRDEDPGRFAGKNSETSGWVKVARDGIAGNPFTTLDAAFISKRPQDMRVGIHRLSSIVAADFGRGPMDGVPCCFVGKDCEKMKLRRRRTGDGGAFAAMPGTRVGCARVGVGGCCGFVCGRPLQ